MAKQANTMMIGSFVVVAVFLLAASVVILGSGKLFKQTTKFVLYFDASIKGLNVGSPVLLQGVQIGSVSSIVIHANRENPTMSIPVIIEIDSKRFYVEDTQTVEVGPEGVVAKLVDKGLRAVLSVQSLITGQLMIELDYYPDSPVNLKNPDTGYIEIPTIPSTTERLFQTLQKIDFVSLAGHVDNTLAGVDRLINNPDLFEGIKSLRQTVDEARQLVAKLDGSIDDVIANIENTLSDTRALVDNVDDQVQPPANDLRQLIKHFDQVALSVDKQVGFVADSLNETLISARGSGVQRFPPGHPTGRDPAEYCQHDRFYPATGRLPGTASRIPPERKRKLARKI